MFKIHKDVRRLTDLEKKQYDVDGYITGLPVFSDEAKGDLDNLFFFLTSRLDKSIDLNQTNMWHKASLKFYKLCRTPAILDYVEDLIGPNFYQWGGQFFLKEPKDGSVVPWHQDAGVTWEEADPYFILTVWLPLVNSTVENGCLEIMPRVHGDGLWEHSSKPGIGTTIPDDLMPSAESLLLPMKKGDVLLMHKEIPHRSGRNGSDGIRWSMDLRYQATGTPTGRPFHPEFVVRSSSNPQSVLQEYDVWCRRWKNALKDSRESGVNAHRWEAEIRG